MSGAVIRVVWLLLLYLFISAMASIGQSLTGVPALSPGDPSTGKEWYNTPAGIIILIISLAMAAGIIYLFIRGLCKR